jgi:hypothetical protein
MVSRAARGSLQPHDVLHARSAGDAAQVYDEACAREHRVVVDTRVGGDDRGEIGVLQSLLQGMLERPWSGSVGTCGLWWRNSASSADRTAT